jgi:hypothetical protein
MGHAPRTRVPPVTPGAPVGRPLQRHPRFHAERSFAVRAEARAEAVPGLRHTLVDTLGTWGLAHAVDDATLVAGELLVRTLHRGATEVELAVGHAPGRLLVEVIGTAPAGLPRRPVPPDMIGGHGTALVQALSLDWAWAPHHQDRCGWALLDVRGGPAPCLTGADPRSVRSVAPGLLPAPGLAELIARVLTAWNPRRPETLPLAADARQAAALLIGHLRPLTDTIAERASRLSQSSAARRAAELAVAEACGALARVSGTDRLAAVDHAQRLARSVRCLLRVRYYLSEERTRS